MSENAQPLGFQVRHSLSDRVAMTPHEPWIAVLSVRSLQPRYVGTIVSKAAVKWTFGTCHGCGASPKLAVRAAEEEAMRQRG